MIKHIWWAFLGTASYWIPIIVVFSVQRTDTNILIANLAAIFGFALFWGFRRRSYPLERHSVWILVGLYFLGPILLSTATTFAKGGFAQIHGWADMQWLLLACVFPPFQFLLAATSGLWPSLLLVSVILAYNSVLERKRGKATNDILDS